MRSNMMIFSIMIHDNDGDNEKHNLFHLSANCLLSSSGLILSIIPLLSWNTDFEHGFSERQRIIGKTSAHIWFDLISRHWISIINFSINTLQQNQQMRKTERLTNLMAPWDDWGDGLLSGYTSSQHLLSRGDFLSEKEGTENLKDLPSSSSGTVRSLFCGGCREPQEAGWKNIPPEKIGSKVNTRNSETHFSLLVLVSLLTFLEVCHFIPDVWLSWLVGLPYIMRFFSSSFSNWPIYIKNYFLAYLVFVCPGQLTCILHLLLIWASLLGIRGNSQFSDFVPERDDVEKKTRQIMFDLWT